MSLSIPKDSGNSNGGGGDWKCKEFAVGPGIIDGSGCLQNEVAFKGLIPDLEAAC